MKEKILPLMVTTKQALDEVINEKYYVLHIADTLYCQLQPQVFDNLYAMGYILIDQGKHGLFFAQTTGKYIFDPNLHEIHDPYHIL